MGLDLAERYIPFNKPYFGKSSSIELSKVLESDKFSGDGPMTGLATSKLIEVMDVPNALLTTSCTQSLELSSLLLDLKPGDEVIMPAFNFTSQAIAVANFGAIPVFVDINRKTKNIDFKKIGSAISLKTRAISVVNYAGIACDFDDIREVASKSDLVVIEDNAHGLGGALNGRRLGSFGDISVQSFHDTKNIQCGEGGSITFNNLKFLDRAKVLREKGTNRQAFLDGQVDKYSWVDLGGSYLLSDILAAILLGQLAEFQEIQKSRIQIWNAYQNALQIWAEKNRFEVPHIPQGNSNTAHMFYLIAPSKKVRDHFISRLSEKGIDARFHYQALHNTKAGIKFGRVVEECEVAESIAETLVRLPLWYGMKEEEISQVIDGVLEFSENS